MPIPKRVLRGQTYEVTMMELRRQPGEVLDAVRDGALVRVTKQGKHIATMVPPGYEKTQPSSYILTGTSDGPMPLTWRRTDLLRN